MGDETKARTYLMAVMGVLMMGAVFYVMRPVVVPVVLAVFFGILVRPLHKWLRQFMPNAVSLTLIVLAVGLALVAIPLLFAANVQAIVDKLPEYQPRINAIVSAVEAFMLDNGIDLSGLVPGGGGRPIDALLNILTHSALEVASVLGTLALMLFTMIFVLTEADVLRSKLTLALPANEDAVIQSVQSIREQLTRYVVAKTALSAMQGIATGVVTWAIGIDFPFVWAVLTFMLNYIPNFGIVIASVPPVLLALIQFDTATPAIVCLIVLIIIYNLIGNVLEPKLLGRVLSLSPLVVFVSLLFWGWYWGFIGFILSVPLTVAIGIVCQHVDALRPIAILIGGDPARLEIPPAGPDKAVEKGVVGR